MWCGLSPEKWLVFAAQSTNNIASQSYAASSYVHLLSVLQRVGQSCDGNHACRRQGHWRYSSEWLSQEPGYLCTCYGVWSFVPSLPPSGNLGTSLCSSGLLQFLSETRRHLKQGILSAFQPAASLLHFIFPALFKPPGVSPASSQNQGLFAEPEVLADAA